MPAASAGEVFSSVVCRHPGGPSSRPSVHGLDGTPDGREGRWRGRHVQVEVEECRLGSRNSNCQPDLGEQRRRHIRGLDQFLRPPARPLVEGVGARCVRRSVAIIPVSRTPQSPWPAEHQSVPPSRWSPWTGRRQRVIMAAGSTRPAGGSVDKEQLISRLHQNPLAIYWVWRPVGQKLKQLTGVPLAVGQAGRRDHRPDRPGDCLRLPLRQARSGLDRFATITEKTSGWLKLPGLGSAGRRR